MSWIIFALGAMSAAAVSDLFRKLGSNLKDPFFSNLIFQAGSITTAIILYLLFSRKLEGNPRGMLYALIGGILISIFTTFTFKALSLGTVSTVIPVIRVGGVLLVAILGVILFRDKLTWSLILGIILASSGVYLIFSGK
jgi:uncharacterized membrane protein